jgi:MFS family permease
MLNYSFLTHTHEFNLLHPYQKLNMQSTYLITSKGYTEKQAGAMFFAFGMSQFLFQTPAGYWMDYTKKKVRLLGLSVVGTGLLTLATAVFAKQNGGNLGLMIFVKFLQGAVTSLIPPGLNSITMGVVGAEGMTEQVAQNEMMHHLGTAVLVITGSLLAFVLYPNVGFLFVVSPVACIGVVYYINQIKPEDIDHNAARGLEDTAQMIFELTHATLSHEESLSVKPSFNFGFGKSLSTDTHEHDLRRPKAYTPLEIFKDPSLLTLLMVCFTFQFSNGTVLPLVMQTLAIGNGRTGILMSGLCIAVAQIFMEFSAELCGKYSPIYGRKYLFVLGLLSLPLRCAILTALLAIEEKTYYPLPWLIPDLVILSTQILDGIGAGVFGTMYILVTSDISGGTGRFNLTLGLTTAAVSLGGTVSGYFGQVLAQDIGYLQAFLIMGCISVVPAFLYSCYMPETLPEMSNVHLNGIVEGDEKDDDDEMLYHQVS